MMTRQHPIKILLSQKPWLVMLITGGLTVLVLLPSLFNDFQRGWDDQWQVLDNPFVSDPSPAYMAYHFTHFFHGQYSPVNTLFYAAVYLLAGYNAAAFHTLSLLIHLTNTFLVFILSERLFELQSGWSGTERVLYAGLTALVFGIHPLQVESVAWISASKVLLYALFTLAALLFYIRYIQRKRYRILVWVMFFYLLAFGSKEQAVILPVTLLTLDWYYGRLSTLGMSPRTWLRPVVVEKVPFFAVALLMWYFSSRNGLGHIAGVNAYPLGQRLVFGAHSIVVYVFRFLAPVKMYYFYFYPMMQGEPLPAMYWSYPVLLAILVWFGVEQYRRGNRLTVFGLLFFTVNLLLVIHLLPMPRRMITADRYMYLSIIGLTVAAVPFIRSMLQWFAERRRSWMPGVLMTMWLAAVGGYAMYRTTRWKDSPTVKRNINELIERRKAQGEKGLENPVKEGPVETKKVPM